MLAYLALVSQCFLNSVSTSINAGQLQAIVSS